MRIEVVLARLSGISQSDFTLATTSLRQTPSAICFLVAAWTTTELTLTAPAQFRTWQWHSGAKRIIRQQLPLPGFFVLHLLTDQITTIASAFALEKADEADGG